MPALRSDDPRDRYITTRFTHDEVERIDAQVPAGVDRSSWIRRKLLGKPKAVK